MKLRIEIVLEIPKITGFPLFQLIPSIITTFEATGSVQNDFYYHRPPAVAKVDEIMYLTVGEEIQEETVVEEHQAEYVDAESLMKQEITEEVTEQSRVEHLEVEPDMMVTQQSQETELGGIGDEDDEEGDATVSSGESESSESVSEGEELHSDESFKPKEIQRRVSRRQTVPTVNISRATAAKGRTADKPPKRPRNARKPEPQKFCEICHKFIKACFSEHLATHSTHRDFVCKVCSKAFTTVRYLKEHLQTHEEASYVCEVCGWKSKTKSNYHSHKKVHSNDKKFECTICPLKFIRSQGLRRHMMTHTGEKPYKCRHCDQVFGSFMTHQMHERLHTGEKPYVCQHCNKSFVGAPALNVSETGVIGGTLVLNVSFSPLSDPPEDVPRRRVHLQLFAMLQTVQERSVTAATHRPVAQLGEQEGSGSRVKDTVSF